MDQGGAANVCGVVRGMGAKVRKRSPDAVIMALASRTHGVVSRAQILDAGISRTQIESRLSDGRLKALYRGVYLVGAVASEHAQAHAALLACGADAVLSHWSAAAIWGLRPYPIRAYPWVTIPREIDRKHIVTKRAFLTPQDVRERHGLRVVSPPRSVLDCAAGIDDLYELEALVAEAHFRRLAREPELRDQIARNPGRPGVRLLRDAVDIEGGPQRTRSGGERWFLRLLRENAIKGFEANAKIHGWEVDFLWRELGFCIELDGWDGHSGRAAFEKDRRKWADLSVRGLTVMPVATRSAQRNKEESVRLVTSMLRQRSRGLLRTDPANVHLEPDGAPPGPSPASGWSTAA